MKPWTRLARWLGVADQSPKRGHQQAAQAASEAIASHKAATQSILEMRPLRETHDSIVELVAELEAESKCSTR